MKKTLTVNLNGRVFNIDEDAYQLLDNYLRNLRIYFRNEEGCAEILADFEARIEELFSDRIRLGYSVITIEEAEKVIAQMGRPGDFGEQDENEKKEKFEKSRSEDYTTVKKKLYRNPNNKMFGGVCSGIAAYSGWDVTVFRIIAAILVLATSLWIIPVYLILWLVVPEATTAEQKLEMQGKPITVENIGKTVAAGVDEIKKTATNSGCLASLVDFIAAFFKVCLVGLGCLIGIPLIFALVIVIIVLFATLLGVGTGILGGLIPWTNETFLYVSHPSIATASLCLILGIPLVALIYSIISHLFKLKPVHKGVKWAGIIIWLAALIAMPFSGFKADWSKINDHSWHINVNNIGKKIHGNGDLIDRIETLSPVDQLEVRGNLNVNLQVEPANGGADSLIINGESNIISKIGTRQRGGKLILDNRKQYALHPTVPVVIRLKTSQLKEIEVRGTSQVDLTGGWQTDRLEVELTGVSRLNLYDLQVNQLEVDANGTSEVRLSGEAKHVEFESSGASKIYAFDLMVDTISAKANGAGLIKCYPVEYLSGKASGAAHVYYKGEPKNKYINTSGAGKIAQE